ncbi:MAG TPA: hypothetical protein VLU24_08220, partial [Mycobacterium sp.]|nr:hypothetical protein [Mycobacterium sp.]
MAPIACPSTVSAACVGDCDGNGEVTVDELIRGVNIALGNTGLNTCASFETNGDSAVTIDELLKGVNNALTGCPGATPTPTPTVVMGVSTPTRTPAPSATPSGPAPTLAPPTVTPTREPFAPAPDPATIAPRLSVSTITDMGSATKFLYDPPPGQPAVQVGMLPGTVVSMRAAVIRGKVMDRAMAPLGGVAITILGRPEFGRTNTRVDGMFDLAVNGGGLLTVVYEKPGFFPVQRTVTVPWQDYAMAPDVCLTQVDPQMTAVQVGATAPAGVARGSMVTDRDGSRRATLFIPPGTQADVVMPDGSMQPAIQLTIHATEYTVGPNGKLAMPAELPPTSAYTYAVEFTADEVTAAGASEVRFSAPVYAYVENFLAMPVGLVVPSGSYARERGAWMAEDNGRVIQVVSITGGAADLDIDGSGKPADGPALSALGISDAERQQLATLYAPGQTLWRVPLAHFSSFDFNYGLNYGAVSCATTNCATPTTVAPPDPGPLDKTCKAHGNSVIECENQFLGEAVDVVGTPFTLHYTSEWVPGAGTKRTFEIPVSGPTIPAGLKGIQTELRVAGRVFIQDFQPLPNQTGTYTWDGLDAYGRALQGTQPASVLIGYLYDGVYSVPLSDFNAFARFGQGPVEGAHTDRYSLALVQEVPITAMLGTWDARGQGGLGGWTLSVHHGYDPIGHVLHLGTGERRSEINALGAVVQNFAGNGDYRDIGDGGPAAAAGMQPFHVATAPDGSVYILEKDGVVRRVAPDGTITTVAGTTDNVNVYCGDDG